MRAMLPGAVFLLSSMALGQAGFALHNGDRVVFYGDSITDNSPYCRMVETFVRTRYPGLDVRFANAGVGGDRVTGGWMGPVDQRLTRDLFSRRPTVITVMLGMNDASYHPFDQATFDTYANGYRHIVDRFQKEAPGARVYLVRPSPFDDVTRTPGWKEGYNSVLLRYSDFVSDLAKQNHYGVIDENGPLTDMLAKAKEIDPANAEKIIPDRVHPGWQGDLAMAEQVLKAWGASPLVSSVAVDAARGTAMAQQAKVENVSHGKELAWTETESALPLPVDRKDPLAALVLGSSDFQQALNQETLKVTGLSAGTYRVVIDGKDVTAATADQLAAGINLTEFDTPMMQQANAVNDLTNRRADLQYHRWRDFEFGYQAMPTKERDGVIRSMETLEGRLVRDQLAAAHPKSHRFQIIAQ